MSKPILSFCQKTVIHLKNVVKQHNCKSLLIGVKSGGCNGLKYNITPIDTEPHKHDELIKIDNLDIHVCHSSLLYLIGTEIIWEESPMGGGLTFINPNAGGQCGCGETFTPG
tara:strand:- start:91 stop:426 length:336 start_codon:yes stop_codon:yes gene_type:complete